MFYKSTEVKGKNVVMNSQGKVSFKQLALLGRKQTCVRAMEWLSGDKRALASVL